VCQDQDAGASWVWALATSNLHYHVVYDEDC
jgi:hypothetical protein